MMNRIDGRKGSVSCSRPALLFGAVGLASGVLALPAAAAQQPTSTVGKQTTTGRPSTVSRRVVTHRHVVTRYHYHRVLVRCKDGRVVAVGPAYLMARRPAVAPTAPAAAAKRAAAPTPAAKSAAAPAVKSAAAPTAAAKSAAAPAAAAKTPAPVPAVTKASAQRTSHRSVRRRHARRGPRWIRAVFGSRR
jgi:hypothetical protein